MSYNYIAIAALFIMYYYRYNIFYLYCKVFLYFDKKPITHISNENILFNYKDCTIIDNNTFNKDNDDIKNLFKINYLKKSNCYQIHPNISTEQSDKQFIFCEIIYNKKNYDITKYINYFLIKNNIILDRPFVTYILFKYFNTNILITEKYVVNYINYMCKSYTFDDELIYTV